MKVLIFKASDIHFAVPLGDVLKIDQGEAPPLISPLKAKKPERIVLNDGRKFCVDEVVDIAELDEDSLRPVPKLLARFTPYLKGIGFLNDLGLLII